MTSIASFATKHPHTFGSGTRLLPRISRLDQSSRCTMLNAGEGVRSLAIPSLLLAGPRQDGKQES